MKKVKPKVESALKVGYVRIYRTLEEWQWYTDIPCKVLYLHCIIRANHTPKKWLNMPILKGSFVTSVQNLSNDTGLSVQQVRTALKKLKSTNEITYTSTNKYTVINVCNYCDWQSAENETNKQINKHINKQITNKQQTNNKQITTTNNTNNIERENRENFEILIKYAELKKVESPTAYAFKVINQTPEKDLEFVVKNLQEEIKKIEEKNAKKIKFEEEKKAAVFKNEEIKSISEYSDNEILKVLDNFVEEKSKNPKIFKSPVVKNAEIEAKKRGLIK